MTTENTVNIFVELDLKATPPVVLTDEQGAKCRVKEAKSGAKIHWKKRDADDSFSILRLEGDESVFTDPDVDGNGQQLSVTFVPNKPSPPPHDYEYNLVVEGPDGEHSTEETNPEGSRVPMDLGRPVIRN
jgi:hypothetical protein